MTESFDVTQVPELEYDETIPPRPEEEVADAARATPDPAGHGVDAGLAGRTDVLQADSRGADDGPVTAHQLD